MARQKRLWQSWLMQRFIPVLIILLLTVGFWFSGLGGTVSLLALSENYQDLKIAASNHSLIAGALFILTYAIVAATALPIASLLSVAGGVLFGPWLGTVYVLFGATCGATALFLAARSAFADTFRSRTGRLALAIEEGFRRNGASYLLFLRLIPAFPFFVVNAGAAFTGVSLNIFIWTTAVGILPGAFVYVYFGASLEPLIASGTAPTLDNLFTTNILIAFSLLGIMALAPIVWRRMRRHRETV